MNRRSFLGSAAAAVSGSVARGQAQQSRPRPNILWITNEDMSPNLGCYGDNYATSPNLDKLAQKSLRYRTAWSTFPVCAPARTTLISGMYPPSTASEHMRSQTSLPPGMLMYPCYLREAGYYCTNNSKEDYNLDHTGKVWDESSPRAHWRNRASKSQPFFAIFNFTITHESQIRTRPHDWIHDPAKARIPAYHPDTPEVRKDWAQYYDNITTMDEMAGKVLAQLEEDGLAEDTIVVYYSDHGSGMPRSKRWPYNSGLHVPLLVHVPEKFKHLAPKDYKPGGVTNRLVAFIDLPVTALSTAGIPKPSNYQGHAFMGVHNEPEQQYIYGFRGRMDERIDMVRSMRDQRYIYIRNYMPHRIYGEHIAYMFETPTTAKWHELYQAGKLNAAQKHFWETKPVEELYDLTTDPDEVNNLAGDPKHKATVERFRKAHLAQARRMRDLGFLPESADRKPRDVDMLVDAADVATRNPQPAKLQAMLKDSDPGVRFWAATGFLIAKTTAPAEALEDTALFVRVPVAESIARYGTEAEAKPAIEMLLTLSDQVKNGVPLALEALNALDHIQKDRVRPYADRIRALPMRNPAAPQKMQGYAANLLRRLSA